MNKFFVRGSVLSLMLFALMVPASIASAQSSVTGTDPEPTWPGGNTAATSTAPVSSSALSVLLAMMLS